MNVLGFVGFGKSGKSSIAQAIVDLDPARYMRRGFALPIKNMCDPVLKLLGVDTTTPEGKEKARPAYVCMGHGMRSEDERFWINKMYCNLMEAANDGVKLFIIDDVRYLNEVQFIQRGQDGLFDGLVIDIMRPMVGAANPVELQSIAEIRRALPDLPLIVNKNDRLRESVGEAIALMQKRFLAPNA